MLELLTDAHSGSVAAALTPPGARAVLTRDPDHFRACPAGAREAQEGRPYPEVTGWEAAPSRPPLPRPPLHTEQSSLPENKRHHRSPPPLRCRSSRSWRGSWRRSWPCRRRPSGSGPWPGGSSGQGTGPGPWRSLRTRSPRGRSRRCCGGRWAGARSSWSASSRGEPAGIPGRGLGTGRRPPLAGPPWADSAPGAGWRLTRCPPAAGGRSRRALWCWRTCWRPWRRRPSGACTAR